MTPTHYYRPYQRPPWGASFTGSVVGKLIIANVAAFFLQQIFQPHFTLVFALVPRAVVENFYVWQLGTYMFLHGGFVHLLFNMFILFIFGSSLEMVWGPRRFLKYYLACGVGGGLLSVVFNYNSIVVGASGAIFGLLLAYAMLFPDNYILLWFVIPVKAKYMVAGLAIIELYLGMQNSTGIAHFAHLGGAATGLLFFRSTIAQKLRFSLGAKQKWNTYTNERREKEKEQETTNIDSILDKISAKGYDNLTTTEKRILDNYSRKRKEESEDD
jgi:membrane associated rhomboid family serine protease